MNNRRDFLKYFFGGAAYLSLAGISSEAWAKKEISKITILHTNDVHSHIDPFPDNDPKYPGLGGIARRASVIKNIREENKNVLLFDSGDIFQGTPYFNIYKGELEFKLMSKLGYDAATIGNHDFDNGLDGLIKPLYNANFPIINANYDFDDTPMNGKTIPNKIFIKDDIKIGVFGLGVELEGLVSKKNYANTRYLNPITIANTQANYLKNEMKCDLVICLSHLGFDYADKAKISDILLAQNTENIDVVLGGHTHTFLDKPKVELNKKNKEVLIAPTGRAGINLGKIEFYIEKTDKRKNSFGGTIKISKNATGK
ncbi:MAG: metallophosphatase [Bacteroidia bacterium]|nr:metallophosphatase [Bacteroidia bacterium]